MAARAAPCRRRAVRVSASRRAAYDVLRAVAERGAYANLMLPDLLRERRITGRDAALATELAYGALRAQGTLDAVIGRCSARPMSNVDGSVLDAVRLGAYQLLYTRIPPHAAVSTSVELAPRRARGFVNAVLRKVSADDLAGWAGIIAPAYDVDPVGQLSVTTAHPRWIVEAFRDALGGDLDETRAALVASGDRPQVHLVARPGRIDRDVLARASGGQPGPWSPYAVRLAEGDPAAITAVRDGRAGVQDEGSQLVAIALATAALTTATVGRPARGPSWWLDMCAGPGGKAALLGSIARQGVRVLAAEPRAHRAAMVARSCAGLPIDVIQADGTAPAWPAAALDRVLVDAPCTGLGALRRRPEARWRRTPDDVPGLTRLQRGLLTHALDAVRPGGIVGYVVCSPHLAETTGVVAAVREQTGAEAVDARPLLPGVPDLGDGPAVQLWPHRQGTDAMFLALLRRPAAAAPAYTQQP
ncbi:MAG: RsmB/NOP family class I SAM-dependent RNA methyltransferase [Mycobacteriales bacterium]